MVTKAPPFASCVQDVRWESLRGSCVRAHLESVCSFHLDVFIHLLSTANYGLHPAVLDLVVVVSNYSVELTWSVPSCPDIRSLSFVSSLMSFSNFSWRRFLVAGKSGGRFVVPLLRAVNDLTAGGRRRPMSLRQSSDEPPAGGGLSAWPPSSSCGRTGCK
jgi:hypothetical protein